MDPQVSPFAKIVFVTMELDPDIVEAAWGWEPGVMF